MSNITLKEEHELEHDENAEPVHAAMHAGELARAARLRERGPRAGKLAAQESQTHTPIMKKYVGAAAAQQLVHRRSAK